MAKMAKKKFETFTPVQVEAALCVWECLNEWTLGNEKDVEKLEEEAKKDPNSHAALRVAWIELREQTGSGEMRSQSIVLGLWCLEIYDLLTKDGEEFFSWWSYDWEVIPCMLSHAVDKDGEVAMYRGDYIYTGKGLIDPHRAAQLVAQEFCWRKFEDECESQAEAQWKYRGLVSDHRDSVRNAFEIGEEPAAFIKSLGEELELIDFK